MEERDRSDEGFLPPEPPGPEPDLGDPEPPPAPPPPPPQSGLFGPPNAGFPSGGPPPQQAYGGWQAPPPGAPPPGYAPPPPQPPPGQPPWQPPPPYAWAPQAPRQPDNGPAVTGFILSMVSAGLWLFTAGISSLISIGLAIGGIVQSRRGKQKIEAGETQKHKGLAQAGYISGIVMVVLAAISTLFWILFVVLWATDEEFQRELENEFDDSGEISAALRLAGAGLRLARLALG